MMGGGVAPPLFLFRSTSDGRFSPVPQPKKAGAPDSAAMTDMKPQTERGVSSTMGLVLAALVGLAMLAMGAVILLKF